MKILVDIGHPAHVHYFRNFIKKINKNNNQILIIARNKDVTYELLKTYDLKYISRGKGGNNIFSKILYFPYAVFKILKEAIKFRPDFYLSFASPYVPIASLFLKKPVITVDDTENDWLSHMFYSPFSDLIITPIFFKKKFGKNHIKINTLFELGSIHPKYFKSDKNFKKKIGLKDSEDYVVLRFVNWNATHDINEEGFNLKSKKNIVEILSKYAKVLISSEGELPDELKKFKIKISVDQAHNLLKHAALYVGESGTMAVEASMLGTPSILYSSLAKKLGNFISLSKEFSLLELCDNEDELISSIINIFENKKSKFMWEKKSLNFILEKIDFTKFLVWLFTNYPESKRQLLIGSNQIEKIDDKL